MAFLQRRCLNGYWVYEKVFSISGNWRNVDQNQEIRGALPEQRGRSKSWCRYGENEADTVCRDAN